MLDQSTLARIIQDTILVHEQGNYLVFELFIIIIIIQADLWDP